MSLVFYVFIAGCCSSAADLSLAGFLLLFVVGRHTLHQNDHSTTYLSTAFLRIPMYSWKFSSSLSLVFPFSHSVEL